MLYIRSLVHQTDCLSRLNEKILNINDELDPNAPLTNAAEKAGTLLQEEHENLNNKSMI